jgi:hypothetical protein
MNLADISLQWDLAKFGFCAAIIGAIIGGIITSGGSYYLWRQQRKHELKNIARAIDIDLEYVYKLNKNWYDYLKKMPGLLEADLDTENQRLFCPRYKFYNDNGAYFIFNHDIAKFEYELSSKIYIFYSRLLSAESERQLVDKNKDVKNDETNAYVRLSYAEMNGLVVWTEEEIPELRKQLKEIYDC